MNALGPGEDCSFVCKEIRRRLISGGADNRGVEGESLSVGLTIDNELTLGLRVASGGRVVEVGVKGSASQSLDGCVSDRRGGTGYLRFGQVRAW